MHCHARRWRAACRPETTHYRSCLRRPWQIPTPLHVASNGVRNQLRVYQHHPPAHETHLLLLLLHLNSRKGGRVGDRGKLASGDTGAAEELAGDSAHACGKAQWGALQQQTGRAADRWLLPASGTVWEADAEAGMTPPNGGRIPATRSHRMPFLAAFSWRSCVSPHNSSSLTWRHRLVLPSGDLHAARILGARSSGPQRPAPTACHTHQHVLCLRVGWVAARRPALMPHHHTVLLHRCALLGGGGRAWAAWVRNGQ